MPEEEAFAVLVQIMQQHRMRDMFKPSMAELGMYFIISFSQLLCYYIKLYVNLIIYIYRFMHVSIGKSCTRTIARYTCSLSIARIPNVNVCFQLVFNTIYNNIKFIDKLPCNGCFLKRRNGIYFPNGISIFGYGQGITFIIGHGSYA